MEHADLEAIRRRARAHRANAQSYLTFPAAWFTQAVLDLEALLEALDAEHALAELGRLALREPETMTTIPRPELVACQQCWFREEAIQTMEEAQRKHEYDRRGAERRVAIKRAARIALDLESKGESAHGT